ncbi:hypothetical protein V2J09_015153 [Rumex salicifolius]
MEESFAAAHSDVALLFKLRMADLAINIGLSLVGQIINLTSHELRSPGNVAVDIFEVKAHLERMQVIVQSRGERSSEVKEVLVQDLRLVAYRIEDGFNGIMQHEPRPSPDNRLVKKTYQAGDVREVKAQLERMQAIVQSRGERCPSVKEILVKDLGKLAHRIEDVLNGIMLHEPHHSPSHRVIRKGYQLGHNLWHRSSLKEINEEIQSIQHDMKDIYDVLLLQVSGFDDAAPRTELQHHIYQSHQDSEILGLKESKQRLMSQVMNTEERNCSAVMVVGPPGSGKTVLAKSIYDDDRVRSHFRIKASVRLSPRFDVANVLSLLLSQIPHSRDTTGDVANDLKNSLKGKRYLVLLDDVWSLGHWYVIKHALPDDSNGSRVVITSTKMDVARSIAASSTQIHLVDGLNKEESWSLFCSKAFPDQNGACPRDLMVLSEEIVHKSEGSPLGILAVATLLGRKQRWPSEWTKVRDNLRSEMESNTLFTDLNNSIQQCFDDLSANQKCCLLYFSLFPQGSYIERARLIRLWVAERFVHGHGEKPAEEVAEEHLNELIRRHLVVAHRDFDYRVKNCTVRNFLHYFLTSKSRKEDFAVMLDNPTTKPGDSVRRLSVADSTTLHSKRVCTLVTFGISKPESPAQIVTLSNQFENLKVLDFQGALLSDFPDCVKDLGLLRYLSLRGSINICLIPSSIKKLRYLEFLDLKYTSVTWLPKEICLLHKLRHLLVYHYHQSLYDTSGLAQGVKLIGEIKGLSRIQKLTLVKAEKEQNFYDQLGCLTQLQKLGLTNLRESNGKSLCESLAEMKRLSVLDLRSSEKSEFLDLDYPDLPCNMLQRVSLTGHLKKLPGWIRSLTSLVRIQLRWSRLETSPIQDLQGLNNLIELHLADAFVGDLLKFGRDGFVSLRVLRLEELTELRKVEVSKGSMPKLESLTLCNCGKLKKLSSSIHSLSELKEIALFDMPVELINSLRRTSLDQSKIKVFSYDAIKKAG